MIIGIAIMFGLGFMAAELMESEKLYTRREHDRRRDIRREFERKMYNYEMYGNIYGNEVNCHGTRKNL